MEHVKIEKHIKKTIKLKEIVEDVKKVLNKIPDIDEFKLNLELTSLVCNLVENSSKNIKKYKISKKDVVLEILKSIFENTLSAMDINKIENDIEYLHSHNLIKKISTYIILGYKLVDFLVQKLF